MVRSVEKFSAKLESYPFIDPKVLLHSGVHIDQSRSKNDVSAGIARAPRRYISRKSIDVEPLRRRPRSGIHILPRHHIRAQRIGVTVITETRIINPKRRVPVARLPTPNSIHLPAANQRIQQTSHS